VTTSAPIVMARGDSLMREKRYTEAEQMMLQALRQSPNDAHVLMKLIAVYACSCLTSAMRWRESSTALLWRMW
jgi:Flp pilus assembly protein TadD